jgi:hypothetical protein
MVFGSDREFGSFPDSLHQILSLSKIRKINDCLHAKGISDTLYHPLQPTLIIPLG